MKSSKDCLIKGAFVVGGLLAGQASALELVPLGNYEGVFFRNSEVFLDNDTSGSFTKGDQIWGVMNLNELVNAGADPSGQGNIYFFLL